MKTWCCGDSLELDDLDLIEAASPEQHNKLLVRVHAAALNFSDILMVQNAYQIKPPRPFCPGQEIAGVVEFAPEGSGFCVGDRIASKVDWAGFSEIAVVPINAPIRLPQSIPFTVGAALPVSYTTAMVGLTECCAVTPNDWVLVHAASGAVGLAAVQIAKNLGARVIGTASTPEKRELAASHGADIVIDYTDKNWPRLVKGATDGRGANVIFDPVGGTIGEQSLHAIARDGTILIVGFASGQIQSIAANRLLLKRASAKGVYWNHDLDPEMMARCTDRIISMLGKGQLRPEICTYDGLTALPLALDDLAQRRSVGKLVLSIGNVQ